MRCAPVALLAALCAAAGCSLAGCGGDSSGPRDGGFDLFDGGAGSGGFSGLGGEGGFGGFGGFSGSGQSGSGEDSDGDGLCDDTEESLGSSSDTGDTDSDGLPDLIELLYGFTLTDPLSPAPERIARLEGRPGAETRFPVRFTVEGESTDFVGFFEDSAAPYDDGSSAGMYLDSSIAIGSEPPEAARAVDAPRQRFLAVLGTARLEIEVRFIAPETEDPERCARAYPFRYGVREDGEGAANDRLYLLLVSGPDADGPEDFCQPLDCL